MRSKMTAMLITLALAVALCCASLMFLNYFMDQADDLCSRAISQVEAQDHHGALESLTTLAEKWEKWAALLESVTSHEDLQEVTREIIDTKTCLEQGDIDDFTRQAAQLGHAIHHIRDQEDIRLSNLF
ncbi:MAG: DUF4363 family protein [Eubacteriales bacterium]|nr:DUF4363 family protein [Eubacteriales bacterium]